MKLLLSIVLAMQMPYALAQSIYKCVGADGKVAFSSLPCEGQAKQAKQLKVPPPETPEASALRLQFERDRREAALKLGQFRRAASDASDEHDRAQNAYQQRAAAAQKRQDARNKEHMAQQEAARLNAARMGNCTTRRVEAGCL